MRCWAARTDARAGSVYPFVEVSGKVRHAQERRVAADNRWREPHLVWGLEFTVEGCMNQYYKRDQMVCQF